jgi:hypothetical protein
MIGDQLHSDKRMHMYQKFGAADVFYIRMP